MALSQIAAAVARRFGDTEEDSWAQLRNGYVGLAPNDQDQIVYVVLDLPVEERAEVEAEFQAVAGEAFVVQAWPACHSTEDLARTAEALSGGGLTDEPGSVYIGDLDPHTSTFQVGLYAREGTLSGADTPSFDSASINPELVRVVDLPNPPVRTAGGRGDDAEPHWAGAEIINEDGPEVCTSGFAVDTQSAGIAMVSAGHCGRVGDSFRSGNNGYGSVNRRGNFPQRDMLIINGQNQNYNDEIYMNPIRSVGNPIDVSGTAVVSASNRVCISGMSSLTSCFLDVEGVNAFFCDNPTGPCTENLIRYNMNEDACTSGDSGAPVFTRVGSSPERARIVGMHIARGSNSAQGAPNGCLAHKTATIENTFDVTVATSP